ncbi:MAG: protein-L-isoaspartate O-methyltransferase [Eubacterium sp.]|nr:protein-L-isoaspartate O-methyltransferase [Eubacterium sp.]
MSLTPRKIIKNRFTRWIMKYLRKARMKIRQKKHMREKYNSLKRLGRQHGVDFGGYLSKEQLNLEQHKGCAYEPSYDMPHLLEKLQVTPQDCFVDIGCGKGYAMHYFSSLPFGKIAGIEITEQLVEIARENLKKLHPDDDRFEVIWGDACNYSSYDEYNYIYLYNPLNQEGIREIVEQLKQSLERVPRKIMVIYQNPAHWKEFCKDDLFQSVVFIDRCLLLRHSGR